MGHLCNCECHYTSEQAVRNQCSKPDGCGCVAWVVFFGSTGGDSSYFVGDPPLQTTLGVVVEREDHADHGGYRVIKSRKDLYARTEIYSSHRVVHYSFVSHGEIEDVQPRLRPAEATVAPEPVTAGRD